MAKKLPSGNWRATAYLGKDENGKRIYKSFTAPTKKEAEYQAMVYKMDYDCGKKIIPAELTVGEAIDLYIDSRDNTVSVSTVRGYRTIRRNCLGALADVKIGKVTEIILQNWANKNAPKYSPKSIRNQFGLITAALNQQKISLNYDSVLLKPRQKIEYNIPDVEKMKAIISAVSGSNVEIPVLMALMLGLRVSEIVALRWADYDGVYINIHGAIVPDEHNHLVHKSENKSYNSRRIIDVPDYLKEKLNAEEKEKSPLASDYIVNMIPTSITRKFQKICEANGLPKYKMHALRHANASLMLMEGVADKYAMERLGHATTHMLKTVYQHTFHDEQRKVANSMNMKFNELCNTKCNTTKRKSAV